LRRVPQPMPGQRHRPSGPRSGGRRCLSSRSAITFPAR
jgi:hypothetical protein